MLQFVYGDAIVHVIGEQMVPSRPGKLRFLAVDASHSIAQSRVCTLTQWNIEKITGMTRD